MGKYTVTLRVEFDVEDERDYLSQQQSVERAIGTIGTPRDVQTALNEQALVVAVDAWEMVGLSVDGAVYVSEETVVHQVLSRAVDLAAEQGQPTESIQWLRTLQATMAVEVRVD